MPFVAGNAGGSGFGSSVTLATPSGTTDGDLLLAWCSTNDAETITPPSGWTQLFQQQVGSGTYAWLFSRTADNEPANRTWTWDESHWHHVIHTAWRDVTLEDHGRNSAASSSSVNVPVFSAEDGDALAVFGFQWSSSTTVTLPQEVTQVAANGDRVAAGHLLDLDAGSTPTMAVTASSNQRICAAGVLLRPIGEEEVPEGDGSLELVVSLSGVGEQPAATVPEGSASLDLELDLGGTGEQPSAGVPEGSGSLDLELDLSGTGELPSAEVPEGEGDLELSVGFHGAGVSPIISADHVDVRYLTGDPVLLDTVETVSGIFVDQGASSPLFLTNR